MKRLRFLMIGGFLGAGKTTAMARLARHYTDQGLNVGLVTNDQAYGLVDTESLRAQGFRVGEVPGACFCCKFDDLVETASRLSDEDAPDVIIAEPVGSCTDLVATVLEPIRHLYGDRFELGPLAVLFKPEHGQKILRNEPRMGFSPKAAYIFLKQIEEADIVALNKVDKLSDAETNELVELVAERFPGKQILALSARRGDGFDELTAALCRESTRRTEFMDVDYDVYADGEAELGWLNCQVNVRHDSNGRFSLDDVLLAVVRQLSDLFRRQDVEPAHLKVLGQSGTETAIANLVGSGVEAELSLASEINTSAADLIVNARVAADPKQLESLVVSAFGDICEILTLRHEVTGIQCFRPSRPVPTHRMTSG